MHKILLQVLKAKSVSLGLLANVEYDGQLSATAYIILAVVFLIIIGGLGWCFYRAVVSDSGAPIQHPDEIGD